MINLHSIYYDDVSDPNWRKERSPVDYDILLLVTQGTLIYELNDSIIPLKKGDMLYIPAATMREAYPEFGHAHQKYSAHFTPAPVPSPLEMLPPIRSHFKIETRQFDYLKQRFQHLTQQWISKRPYYAPLCCSILQEMLAITCREFDERQFPYKKLALVHVIQQYILDHYTEPIRIEHLAALVDRTPNYVTSLFRETIGHPPIDYVHQVRVSAARDMLLNTNKSIRQVAEELGFCDQSYFNRVFRKIVGYPPSAIWRARD
ncbi:AraC family transcriptional regulator [Paenibacillus sp. HWE-109]|uniref:helix-turn-helix domain-containing protein n=1 Tax=Paenibacillus sp. HWE-109 TaxID=1306526 RepID=UPI001EDCD556|nr:AraC family transcriptional regulator [Paenibacillus sp. HWE-109]UKS30989.1 AraC family transcriptional regulator [Paenibacillus sp. HWE-109]